MVNPICADQMWGSFSQTRCFSRGKFSNLGRNSISQFPPKKNRTPQSAHHPHKNHVEHRNGNLGGGAYIAALPDTGNFYSTLSKIPLSDRKSLLWVWYVVAVFLKGIFNPARIVKSWKLPMHSVSESHSLPGFAKQVLKFQARKAFEEGGF